jgi:hypothetical protein
MHLLVPDAHSILANSIRSMPNNPDVRKELFAIPFTDLKFRPKFGKKNYSAFQVKNTNQVKKITENQRPAGEITFKVLNQKKKESGIPDPRCYYHELEIEPFSLEVEGLPKTSQIVFDFGYGQSFELSPETLIKTKLHNSKLLDESAGKTFTMKINH